MLINSSYYKRYNILCISQSIDVFLDKSQVEDITTAVGLIYSMSCLSVSKGTKPLVMCSYWNDPDINNYDITSNCVAS